MHLARAFGLAITSTILFATNAAAQVVSVGFGDPQAVPLSPWITALLSVLLSVAALAFLRKKIGAGAFLFMLSVAAGGIALKAEDSLAIPFNPPPQLNLVTSPATFDYTTYGFNGCGAKLITVASASPTTIRSITVTPGTDWIIDQASSTCSVGQVVGTCVLRIERILPPGDVGLVC